MISWQQKEDPLSKMDKADKKTFAVCEYENDTEFSDLLSHPDEYIEILKQYQGFISPDCSVYRDMPLSLQITNIYRNRAIGYCMQKYGLYVIPCVRWGGIFFRRRIGGKFSLCKICTNCG